MRRLVLAEQRARRIGESGSGHMDESTKVYDGVHYITNLRLAVLQNKLWCYLASYQKCILHSSTVHY